LRIYLRWELSPGIVERFLFSFQGLAGRFRILSFALIFSQNSEKIFMRFRKGGIPHISARFPACIISRQAEKDSRETPGSDISGASRPLRYWPADQTDLPLCKLQNGGHQLHQAHCPLRGYRPGVSFGLHLNDRLDQSGGTPCSEEIRDKAVEKQTGSSSVSSSVSTSAKRSSVGSRIARGCSGF